jgi:hypothetical protein
MTIRLDLNVNELNNMYYALGMLLVDGAKETIGLAPRKQYNDLQDKIWKSIVEINKHIDIQLEQDKLDHDMQFKSSYIQHGDY